MTTLSPKAVRFVDDAVRRFENAQVAAAWAPFAHAPAGELPASTAAAVLRALEHAEQALRAELNRTHDEDEASDLSNDLGFICAIENDLRREARRRA
jgi:hypothetical protein